ncbi:MAG: DUF4403 family protein [Myxococcota bacterium]|jgi:hypothetical protein|nr:DUF4403 family protein [Myxococcota bacterium]
MNRHLIIALTTMLCACSEALYPPRPPVVPGPPIADPPHTRLTLHASFTKEGLRSALDSVIPVIDKGSFSFLGTREYRWQRGPLEIQLDNAAGKVTVQTIVKAQADLPGTTLAFDLKLVVDTQPVVASDYTVQLQTPLVVLSTDDKLLRLAEWFGGVVTMIRTSIEDKLRVMSIDLRPMLEPAYADLARPIRFPIGDAQGCVQLGVQSVEAGPTLLVGGFEKDIGVTLTPSVTLPCAAKPSSSKVELPPLRNVSAVDSSTFEVVVPVAASYDELRRAMSQAFSGGKLFFSKEQPELYLENPEIYASGGLVVVKVHIDGKARKGITTRIYGDIYLAGHPQVRDNELLFPDLEPTVESSNLLLRLASKLSKDDIRRQVQQALRLDISLRLAAVKETLSQRLTYVFDIPGSAPGGQPLRGCVQAKVGRIELSDLYAHDSYLRLYVKAIGQAAAYVPCPRSVLTSLAAH